MIDPPCGRLASDLSRGPQFDNARGFRLPYDAVVALPQLNDLRALTEKLAATPFMARAVDAARNRQPVTLDGVVGSSCCADRGGDRA